MRKMFTITVNLNDGASLFFTVIEYSRQGTHITFIDQKTGLTKSFPDNICYIEEVRKWSSRESARKPEYTSTPTKMDTTTQSTIQKNSITAKMPWEKQNK